MSKLNSWYVHIKNSILTYHEFRINSKTASHTCDITYNLQANEATSESESINLIVIIFLFVQNKKHIKHMDKISEQDNKALRSAQTATHFLWFSIFFGHSGTNRSAT